MSEWGRLQDSLHDHFDEQGVTGVDVDKLIEHLVNVRDFFPGLMGAGRSSDPALHPTWYRPLPPRSSDPEPAPPEEPSMSGHALDGVLSDADIALAAVLSVAVPDMLAEEAMQKAPDMIDHLRNQGFDVTRLAGAVPALQATGEPPTEDDR